MKINLDENYEENSLIEQNEIIEDITNQLNEQKTISRMAKAYIFDLEYRLEKLENQLKSIEDNLSITLLNNKNDLKKYLTARIDIKNYGLATNSIEILTKSDNNCEIYHPDWFKNSKGEGITLTSFEGKLELKIKCINDGNLHIDLRGIDFKIANNLRIPIFIDFTRLTIDDKVIFNKNTLAHHDKTIHLEMDVKNNQQIIICVEWIPLNWNSE